MSMGYSAAGSYVIEIEDIRKLQFRSFFKLEEKMKECNLTFDTLNEQLDNTFENTVFLREEEVSKSLEEVESLMNDFLKEFRDEYQVRIEPFYHDQENHGGSYDEVSGGAFGLFEVDLFDKSEAYHKLSKDTHFDHKTWVEYS